MALPETSRMQCLPLKNSEKKKKKDCHMNCCTVKSKGHHKTSFFITAIRLFITSYRVELVHLFCNLSHWLHACPIKVVVILARLDELVILNVFFHLLPWDNKMVVSGINLVVSLWSSRVWSKNSNDHYNSADDIWNTAKEIIKQCTHGEHMTQTCLETLRLNHRWSGLSWVQG